MTSGEWQVALNHVGFRVGEWIGEGAIEEEELAPTTQSMLVVDSRCDQFLDSIALLFTPLESPAIHSGDNIIRTLIAHREGRVRAASFLTGFTSTK